MRVLGIDPAPSKDSVIFDGECFIYKKAKNLQSYITELMERDEPLFIAWDAPLSAAIERENFSLSIRKIESFFYRQSRSAKSLDEKRGIPHGISTLGYSSCPHWTISQHLFGYPVLNHEFIKELEWKLIMDNEREFGKYNLTEIHPALSMWILLKDKLSKSALFAKSWQYKGANTNEVKERLLILIKEIAQLPLTHKYLKVKVDIKSDDELDAFVCWLMGQAFVSEDEKLMIYGDRLNGSFLLPKNEEIIDKLDSFLMKHNI